LSAIAIARWTSGELLKIDDRSARISASTNGA
jgi:hypothetical protein